MTYIRRPLVGLVALFTAAVAIDRVGLTSSGTATIDTAVYALAVAAVAAPLTFAGMRRSSAVGPTLWWLAVYAIVTGVGEGSIALGAHLSETVVEVTFLGLSSLLAHWMGIDLQTIDDSVGAAMFGASAAVSLDDPSAAGEIHSEMARARRHGRPLTVTLIAPDPDSMEMAVDHATEDMTRAMKERWLHGNLARIIGDQLRRSDLLFEHRPSGRFVVVSPETGESGSSLLTARIRENASRLRVKLRSGSASFPDGALTFEDLVQQAEARLEGLETPQRASLRAVDEPAGGGA